MTIDLSGGKTALITGASRGIGAAGARAFVEAGASVVLAARTAGEIDALAAELGDGARAVVCDVADYGAVERAVGVAVEAFGGLDILVNNAGTIEPIARLEESDPAEWGTVIDVNLKGVYHGMRAAHGPMVARGGGVIVNISSGAATGVLEGWLHYCASKAGVLSLTKGAHLEWADQGVRVVGLSPGTVATDMQVAIRDSGVNAVSKMDWDAHIPPEWVARAMVWLCTDAARHHDGGDFSLKTDAGRAEVGLPGVRENAECTYNQSIFARIAFAK